MTGTISLRYALRNLGRNRTRSVLSLLGIGIGVAIALIATSWIRGGAEMEIRALAESGAGHLRIVPAGWRAERGQTQRLSDRKGIEEQLGALPAVKSGMPHARMSGLLACGNRAVGVEITGVRPEREQAANRIVARGSLQGRYLQEGERGRVVIGRAIARRLRVDLDDDLFLTVAGVDGVRGAMLRVVGILTTGVRDLDGSFCHVSLETIAEASGLAGLSDMTVLLHDPRQLEATQRQLAAALPGMEVVSWKEVNPGMAAGIDGDRAFMGALVAIIILVVGLGIVSAQLTAVMERRREIAVLTALGMRTRQIIVMVLLEAMVLALGGSVVALAMAGPVTCRLAARGVELRLFLGDESGFGDILLDPVMYGDFGPWLVPLALALSFTATMAASLYPAWFASRVVPADATRL